MSAQFHRLTVKSLSRPVKDALTITLELPAHLKHSLAHRNLKE